MRDGVSFISYIVFCLGFWGVAMISAIAILAGLIHLSWYGLAWAAIFWVVYFAVLASVVILESNTVTRFLWGKVLRGEVSYTTVLGGEKVRCSINGYNLYMICEGGEHGTTVRVLTTKEAVYNLCDNLRVSNLAMYWVLRLRAMDSDSPSVDASLLRKYKE